MSKINPNGITVSLRHDINTVTDHIAANVSTGLTSAINRKLLGEVCENLFGIADLELVRDTFEAIRLDPEIQDRVVAIRAARRIGVK
jgi:hypothetical protein